VPDSTSDSTAPNDPHAPFQAGALVSRALFDQSPFSTVIYDASGHIVALNEAFRRFWGVGVESAPPDYSVLNDRQLEEQGALAYIRRAFEGEAVVTPAVRYDISKVSTTGTGREVWTEAHLYPVRSPSGAITNVVLVHVDITERMDAQQALSASEERSRRLLTLATALSQSATFDEVAHAMFTEGIAAVSADAGSLGLAYSDGGVTRVKMIRSSGYSREVQQRYANIVLTSGRPLSDAMLNRTPVLLESAEAWAQRYPNQFTAAGIEYEAYVALPIVVGDRTVAGLSFNWKSAQRFDDESRTLLATISQLCAQALERARAFDAERRARDASQFLAEASRLLSSSLDLESTMRNLATAAVPRFADWCTIEMLENPESAEWPPRLRRIALAHDDPAKLAWGEALSARLPTDWDQAGGLPRVFREKVSEFIPRVTDEMLVAGARSPEQLELMRELHLSSLIMVPLSARGRLLGALTLLLTDSERVYDASDLEVAEDLGRRAATAIDNSTLYLAALEAQRAAEQANQAKMEFLATMSHELRTPLNAIGGYAELLHIGVRGPVTPAQQLDLERIQHSQQHLLSLINDVLNFAKLEAGKVEIRLGPVRVRETLEDLEPLLSPQLASKGLTLDSTPCDATLTVRADEDKLRQVLLNVLSNAVKFTPEGGRITVGCEHDEREVRIVVRDTGIGVAGEYLERIFDPFVQLERRLTNVVAGTGLGLAISRDLARAMNGDISVVSTPGVGSTFTVHVPRETTRSAE
jgi:PAS domain S-box-containing protein